MRRWSGKRIKVVKHEMSNLDEALINLGDVSHMKKPESLDGYGSRHALHLNGTGMIETDMNKYEELPANVFEIPLEEDALYEFDGTRFILSTSRGVYTMELLEDR